VSPGETTPVSAISKLDLLDDLQTSQTICGIAITPPQILIINTHEQYILLASVAQEAQ
jgi:hypothetical protein